MIEVIWARYFFAFVFMLALFLPRSGLKLFRFRRLDTPGGARPAAVLLVVPLLPRPRPPAAGDRGGDLAHSPIIVTALSARLLGEPVGPRRWAAVCVGFIGALIVVRPGQARFDWHVLLIVASTICSAFYQLFSRRYGQSRAARRLGHAGDHRRHGGGERRSCRSNG